MAKPTLIFSKYKFPEPKSPFLVCSFHLSGAISVGNRVAKWQHLTYLNIPMILPPSANPPSAAGAWHTPEVFMTVITKLRGYGYKCIALPLQAVGHVPAVQTLLPDMASIHGAVFSEIHEEGNDVVMVAHSWSGTVVGGSLEGLGKAERERDGEKGGVVRLAFVSAFVPFEGVSLIEALGGTPPEWYDVKEPWVMPLTPEKIFYHDLPPSEAAYWSSKLKPHSYATKFVGASTAAWRTIPSSYLICENDRAIPVFLQEAMVKACQDAGADMKTERLFASHSPFLSKPDEFVAFLRRAAGDDV